MKRNKLLSGKWALLGGKIYDPYEDKFLKGDILLNNGKIEKIGKIQGKNIHSIDCSRKIITSGFTDIRTHFRMPGLNYVETLDSGVSAAMAGGYTSVCLMSDECSPLDSPESINNIVDISKNAIIDILPIGSASIGHKGKELCEYGYMVEEGAVAFSDTIHPVQNSQFLKYALEYSGMYETPFISYPKDNGLSDGGVVNEGIISTKLGLKGVPDISESMMIYRDLMITQLSNQKIHIPIVSTGKSADIIKEFQKNGVNVTADTSPHYIFFNENKISDYNSNAKVYPPLRSEQNRKQIIKAIRNNIITCISSDHSPCSSEDKEKDIAHAPFGTVSLESAFSMSLTALINEGFNITDVIKLFTKGPVDILGIHKNSIKIGTDADLTIIDPNNEWIFQKADIYSKSKNSIALDAKLVGRVDMTICKKNAFGDI